MGAKGRGARFNHFFRFCLFKKGPQLILAKAAHVHRENAVKWSGAELMLISNEMRNELALALRLINGKNHSKQAA